MPPNKIRRALTATLATTLLVPALAAVAANSASAATADPSASVSPAVEVCGAGAATERPGSMVLTCADNGELAENLVWSSWTGTSATATGTVTWRACAADCATATTWDSTSADVTLTDPVSEAGNQVLFTKLELNVTGSTPKGFMRQLTFNEAPVSATATPVAPAIPAPNAAVDPAQEISPAAASGTLAYSHIEGFWIDAGGPSSVAETAAAITGAESSFEPGIIQQGVAYCGAGADRAGWGLWQITCGNSVPAYGTDFQVLDPWNNAEAAVSKYDDAGGFSPWSTYTSGAYENYLENVSADTSLTDPGEYDQAGSTPSGTPSSPAANPGSTYGPGIGSSSTNIDSWKPGSTCSSAGHQFCLWYGQGDGTGGAGWGSSGDVGTITGTFTIGGSGAAGYGQAVRNNAASMTDATSNCNVTTWYSPNSTGPFNWLKPDEAGNLTSGLRNNEASISANSCS
jgi:hypothetical protein